MPKDALQTPPLRAVRTARGLSLREVARRAELDPAHLSRVERGLVRPSLRTLAKLARVLELRELAKLLGPFDPEEAR
jgi:transcriptional regulator with XRE-family HTH domain